MVANSGNLTELLLCAYSVQLYAGKLEEGSTLAGALAISLAISQEMAVKFWFSVKYYSD